MLFYRTVTITVPYPPDTVYAQSNTRERDVKHIEKDLNTPADCLCRREEFLLISIVGSQAIVMPESLIYYKVIRSERLDNFPHEIDYIWENIVALRSILGQKIAPMYVVSAEHFKVSQCRYIIQHNWNGRGKPLEKMHRDIHTIISIMPVFFDDRT